MATPGQINAAIPISSLPDAESSSADFLIPAIRFDVASGIYRPYKVTSAGIAASVTDALLGSSNTWLDTQFFKPPAGTARRGVDIEQLGPDGGTTDGTIVFNRSSSLFRSTVTGNAIGFSIEVGANHAANAVEIMGLSSSVTLTESGSVGEPVGLTGGMEIFAGVSTNSNAYGGHSAAIARIGSHTPQIVGWETDNFLYSALVPYRFGYTSGSFGDHNANAKDAAFGVFTAGGSTNPWKTIISLISGVAVGAALPAAVATDGVLFDSESPVTMARGLDLRNITMTGPIIETAAKTYLTDGNLTLGSNASAGQLVLNGPNGTAVFHALLSNSVARWTEGITTLNDFAINDPENARLALLISKNTGMVNLGFGLTLAGSLTWTGQTGIPQFIAGVSSLLTFDVDGTLGPGSDTRIPSQSAVKAYVDNSIDGLKFALDVVAASTANVNIASAPATLDGVTLTNGDRVLLKNQATGSQNGSYIFHGAAVALTRATDGDTGAELVSKTFPVRTGTVNQDTWWTVTNDSIVIGTTAIVFTQTGGAGTYSNGSGLFLAGNQFSIDTGVVVTLTGAQALSNKTLATPVINGLPTGTGVASAATNSTLVARDGSGNFAANTITAALAGNASTATNATNAAAVPGTGITGAAAWTPALKFGGAAVGMTSSLAGGRILQLSNGVIIATGRITLTAKGSSTGPATITGLPTALGGIEGNIRFGYYQNLASIASVPLGYVSAGGTTINLQNSGAASTSSLTEANFTNTSDIIFAVVGHIN